MKGPVKGMSVTSSCISIGEKKLECIWDGTDKNVKYDTTKYTISGRTITIDGTQSAQGHLSMDGTKITWKIKNSDGEVKDDKFMTWTKLGTLSIIHHKTVTTHFFN